MPNYILEGESFFVLQRLSSLVENKKIEINPDQTVSCFSLLSKPDYYVYFDPDKQICEGIKNNFIICFMDKNVDQRLDYIKSLKQKSELLTFDPIPTTDLNSLKKIFSKINISTQNFPFKKVNLKYKNVKQNFEWFDLCLINDFYHLENSDIFSEYDKSYFDIWSFMDLLWNKNISCLQQIKYINNDNFEEYFNRIRETIKDYLEVFQSSAKSFIEHKKIIENPIINNEFRFLKVKEKINKINHDDLLDCLKLFDQCIINVRKGSNAKLEVLSLYLTFKNYVL